MRNPGPLQVKSKAFAVRTVKLARYLEAKKHEYVLSRQILRSGTSIGANIHEAQGAQSLADFASKCAIALKEANETSYWLELLHETDYLTEKSFMSVNSDLDELISMLVKSIKTLKSKSTTR